MQTGPCNIRVKCMLHHTDDQCWRLYIWTILKHCTVHNIRKFILHQCKHKVFIRNAEFPSQQYSSSTNLFDICRKQFDSISSSYSQQPQSKCPKIDPSCLNSKVFEYINLIKSERKVLKSNFRYMSHLWEDLISKSHMYK